MPQAIANLTRTPPAVPVKPAREVFEAVPADSDGHSFQTRLESSQRSAEPGTPEPAQESTERSAETAPEAAPETEPVDGADSEEKAIETKGPEVVDAEPPAALTGETVLSGLTVAAPAPVPSAADEGAGVSVENEEGVVKNSGKANEPRRAETRVTPPGAKPTAAPEGEAAAEDRGTVQAASDRGAADSEPVVPESRGLEEPVEKPAHAVAAATTARPQTDAPKPASAEPTAQADAQVVPERAGVRTGADSGGQPEGESHGSGRGDGQGASVSVAEPEVHFKPLEEGAVDTAPKKAVVSDDSIAPTRLAAEPVQAVPQVKNEPAALQGPARPTPVPVPQSPEPPSSLQQATERTMIASAQRGLSAAMAQRGGEMTIRLAPEALGSLRIALSVAEGTVSATLTASEPAAAHMLKGNLNSLRESIEARGLTVDRLTVTNAATNASASEHASGRSEQQLGREGDRSNAGDGRSRGRGDDDTRQNNQENKRESRFTQQWKLALDATA